MQASKANWGAYRAIQHTRARVGWQHTLTDDAAWELKLAAHFKSIFAKASPARTRRRLADTHQVVQTNGVEAIHGG